MLDTARSPNWVRDVQFEIKYERRKSKKVLLISRCGIEVDELHPKVSIDLLYFLPGRGARILLVVPMFPYPEMELCIQVYCICGIAQAHPYAPCKGRNLVSLDV